MAVTLINVFNVPADKEKEFLENWRRTAEFFSKRDGFIETHLHRNTGVGNQTFQFVNVARWKDANAWSGNHDDYKPTEYEIPGVKGHPAIFQTAINVYSDDYPEGEKDTHWISQTS